MAETPQSTVRLTKADHKNIDKVKVIMKSKNIPENSITRSSAIQFALAETAKGAR